MADAAVVGDSSSGVVCDKEISVEGTSLRGNVTAVPKQLIAAFGPGDTDGDPKTALEWHFKDSVGSVWAIYDWKMLSWMSPQAIKDHPDAVVFNIGGHKGGDPIEFREYLNVVLANAQDEGAKVSLLSESEKEDAKNNK
eukprot:m.49807 g.49807  ORF g.49807 m.49807 type:complete len:139 (-) comp16204_c0_seq1:118-534(-)